MAKNKIYIDFEFNNTSEELLNLVSCSLQMNGEMRSWWLHKNPEGAESLKRFLLKHKKNIFVAFGASAEARAFLSLGIDPIEFKWIDIRLEYLNLLNQNNIFSTGMHLVKSGKVKDLKSKSYGEVFTKEVMTNLVGCCYKFLDIVIDSEEKDRMRDLIISAPETFTEKEREDIMAYCESDVIYLREILSKMATYYKDNLSPIEYASVVKGIILRGEFAARTSLITKKGYPLDVESCQNLSDNAPRVIKKTAESIIEDFPDRKDMFFWDKKQDKYILKQIFKEYLKEDIGEEKLAKFKINPKTTKGVESISLGLRELEKHYPWKHDYPQDIFIARFMEYRTIASNLKSFKSDREAEIEERKDKLKKKKVRTIFRATGSDSRTRHYHNIFGTQTSRSMPPTTEFLFGKSAWLRSLCVPKKGKCIVTVDYSSQEFYICGLLSKDENMIRAYESGDPYLAFAILANAAPSDATKKSHGVVRNLFKSTVLGISYGMGAESLAAKLTNDTGTFVSEEEAEDLIEQFEDAFPEFEEYGDITLDSYSDYNKLILPDGWVMWGDNNNERSIKNFPVQGMGATVLRKAVELVQKAGLDIVFTLHDAIYIECDSKDKEQAIDILTRAMKEAFQFFFKRKTHIRTDAEIWSPDFEVGNGETKEKNHYSQKNIYIDGRSAKVYDKYSMYFNKQ